MLSVELRDMRWALITSRHRSLRQAAESLNIRQSTLSRRLREMEIQLGAGLFERTNGGTRPTVAGREFLASAQRILAETDAAIRRLQVTASGASGRLRIGVYASLSTGNIYATLVDYRREFREVEILAVDGGHDRLFCALAKSVVDVAVMAASRSSWDDRSLPLWSERVILAVPERSSLSKKDIVSWPDLIGETILIPHNGPGPELERLLISRLPDHGAQRLLRQEVGLDRLLSLVAAEFGALLMLEGGAGIRYEAVSYREIREANVPTRLSFAAYSRQSNENPTLAPSIGMLRQRYPDLSGSRDPA